MTTKGTDNKRIATAGGQAGGRGRRMHMSQEQLTDSQWKESQIQIQLKCDFWSL